MNVRNIITLLKQPASKLVLIIVFALISIVWLAPGISRMMIERSGSKPPAVKVEDVEYNSRTNIKPLKDINFNFSSFDNEEESLDSKKSKNTEALLAQIKVLREKQKSIIDSKLKGTAGYTPNRRSGSKNKESLESAVKSLSKTASKALQPLNIYNNVEAEKEECIDFLPYGIIVPCQLIITLQSSNSGTPIIGMVTEDIYNEGKRLIPAGTQVHGDTAGMPLRDHAMTGTEWILVWRTRDKDNGKELKIQGLALDNGSHWNGKNWDLLDGSNGIKGFITDNRSSTGLSGVAVKLATGAANGLATAATMASAFTPLAGGEAGGELIGAATQGIGGALGSSAEQSAQIVAQQAFVNEMESNYYITCPAGTQFYLYIKGTINMNEAKIGATKG